MMQCLGKRSASVVFCPVDVHFVGLRNLKSLWHLAGDLHFRSAKNECPSEVLECKHTDSELLVNLLCSAIFQNNVQILCSQWIGPWVCFSIWGLAIGWQVLCDFFLSSGVSQINSLEIRIGIVNALFSKCGPNNPSHVTSLNDIHSHSCVSWCCLGSAALCHPNLILYMFEVFLPFPEVRGVLLRCTVESCHVTNNDDMCDDEDGSCKTLQSEDCNVIMKKKINLCLTHI